MDIQTIQLKKQTIAKAHDQMKTQVALIEAEIKEKETVKAGILQNVDKARGAYEVLTELEAELGKEAKKTKEDNV